MDEEGAKEDDGVKKEDGAKLDDGLGIVVGGEGTEDGVFTEVHQRKLL